MKGQRAYCDREHPISDADADRWCEVYHRPQLPACPDHFVGAETLRCLTCGGESLWVIGTYSPSAYPAPDEEVTND